MGGHDIDGHLEINEFATTEFDDTWDEIATMISTDGRSIRRKCLHIWKGRLCLCQFLGWIDNGKNNKKYHCIYHQIDEVPYENIQIHHIESPKQPQMRQQHVVYNEEHQSQQIAPHPQAQQNGAYHIAPRQS